VADVEHSEKKRLKWKAEKTSISELPSEEKKKRLGLKPTEAEMELIREVSKVHKRTKKKGKDEEKP